MYRLVLAPFAFATILSAGPAQAAVTVGSDSVLYWNQVLSTGLAGSPTVTSRGFAMVSVAIHDAANATSGNVDRGYFGNIATPGGDTRAAVAVAARNVLVALNPAKTAEFDAALAASLALVPDGAGKTNGMATGALIAAAALAGRAADGSTAVVPYTPSGLPGRWAPTPPGNVPASLPQWGSVTPWLLASGNQFRAGPPPAIDSAEYATALNEVKDIGALNSATRTADQTAAAVFWEGASGTGPWVQAAINAVEAKGLSTMDNARLFALLSTSTADAAIATWDTKYTYDFWRPVTAIRNADLDGNAATIQDPNWTSRIVAPPHPSYLSAHSAVAGTASGVLQGLLGDSGNFCMTVAGNTRCWDSYALAATDAANSRLWGGIHFRFDNEAGLTLGGKISTLALASNPFAAVPEPSSWAMMVAGFGLLGGLARRRRAPARQFA